MMINLRFQPIEIELFKQPKQKQQQQQQQKKKTEKEHLRFVIISIRVGVFAKNDGEICVLSTIKTYNYFS